MLVKKVIKVGIFIMLLAKVMSKTFVVLVKKRAAPMRVLGGVKSNMSKVFRAYVITVLMTTVYTLVHRCNKFSTLLN